MVRFEHGEFDLQAIPQMGEPAAAAEEPRGAAIQGEPQRTSRDFPPLVEPSVSPTIARAREPAPGSLTLGGRVVEIKSDEVESVVSRSFHVASANVVIVSCLCRLAFQLAALSHNSILLVVGEERLSLP